VLSAERWVAKAGKAIPPASIASSAGQADWAGLVTLRCPWRRRAGQVWLDSTLFSRGAELTESGLAFLN